MERVWNYRILYIIYTYIYIYSRFFCQHPPDSLAVRVTRRLCWNQWPTTECQPCVHLAYHPNGKWWQFFEMGPWKCTANINGVPKEDGRFRVPDATNHVSLDLLLFSWDVSPSHIMFYRCIPVWWYVYTSTESYCVISPSSNPWKFFKRLQTTQNQDTSWHSGWWFEPLWKIWKSIGMIIPSIWENKIDVPNHQPAFQWSFRNWSYPMLPPHHPNELPSSPAPRPRLAARTNQA